MPLMWVPPAVWGVLEQNGLYAPVYHTYDQQSFDHRAWFHFTFNPDDDGNENEHYDIRDFVPGASGLSLTTLGRLQELLDHGDLTLAALPVVHEYAQPRVGLYKQSTNVDPDYAADRDDSAEYEMRRLRISYVTVIEATTYDGCRAEDIVAQLGGDLTVELLEGDDGAR